MVGVWHTRLYQMGRLHGVLQDGSLEDGAGSPFALFVDLTVDAMLLAEAREQATVNVHGAIQDAR